MRTLARLFLGLAISSLLAVPTGAVAPQSFDDPIRGAAHGAAFGADGREITVTAEFISRAQAAYTARAMQSAGVLQRARHALKRSYLEDLARGAATAADQQAALYGASLLLDWLIDEVKPADAALLRQRNRVLMSFIRRGLPYMPHQTFAPQPHQLAQLQQAGVAAAAALPVPPAEVLQARETYAKKCRKAGVPIPPTWGTAAWTRKDVVADPFISETLTAVVFYYESAAPEGICLALPRHGPGAADPHELLGIICQGKVSSKACFWDNQLNDVGQPIPRTGEFPINTSFAAGEELDGGTGGTCTACHAGENAYIVHPDDPAFSPDAFRKKLMPDKYYSPMVVDTWPKNLQADNGLDDIDKVLGVGEFSCQSCHVQGDAGRLPKIIPGLVQPNPRETKVYCDVVLRQAINKTMPQPAGAASAPYKKHTDFLLAECNRVKP